MKNSEMHAANSDTFPIAQVRAQFPALEREHNGKRAAYLDGPGGTQVVEAAIEAIAGYMRRGGANLHGPFPSSIETEQIILEARTALADLLGAEPDEIAFGANATSLAFAVARAVSRNWRPGDEIVVTELDHRAGVDPWITAAADKGVTVRWLKVDPETLTLDYSRLDEIIHEKTVLVSVGLASNVVGTVNDVRLAAKKAKRHGALMVVDAVHAVPHIAIDRDQLGADILLCSVYKFFGPHIGVAAIKKETFEKMEPYKISPAPGCIPDKLETGTQNHEGIAGIRPAVEFIASLGAGETRRARIVSAMERIEAYENSLAEKIREELSRIHGVRLYQAPRGVRKTPTIAFTLDGRHPREVCRFAVDHYSVFIADGDFYAATLAEKLNLKESGGWIRAGLAPYNTLEEAERLIAAVKRCAR